ncbi:MAG: DUF5683 domain-containing protein [Ignavibacteriaceae bacterium]
MIKTTTKIALIVLLVSITNIAQQQEKPDTIKVEEEQGFQMQKSPWGAVLRSAIIPGWGQFYNEDYLHIPVIWGLLGWFAYNWVLNNKDYNHYSDLYKNSEIDIYRTYRDFYRDQRDRFTIYFTIAYFLNLVDAFVGAHLFDFSVEEDYLLNTYRLNIRYNF